MAFGASWGPAAWIVVPEVWPLSSRPYGIALGASSNWMNNFIVGQVTPDMLSNIQYGTFILFGLLTVLGGLFIIFFVPETKCLSLEEMVSRHWIFALHTADKRTGSHLRLCWTSHR